MCSKRCAVQNQGITLSPPDADVDDNEDYDEGFKDEDYD